MFVEGEKKFYVFILFLFFYTECRSSCTRDLDCNKPLKYVKCRICVKGKCEIIDKEIFNPKNNSCEYSRQHCRKGDCTWKSEAGVSFEGYGECVCICPEKIYGRFCDKILPNGSAPIPTGIYSIMPPYVEFNQVSSILVFSNGAAKPYIVISDYSGGYFTTEQVKPVNSHKWDHNACVKLFSSDKFLRAILDMCELIDFNYCDNVFVIPFVIPFDLVTERAMKVTSFTRVMGISTYRSHPITTAVIMAHDYAISYPKEDKFTTTPIVRFTNCGPKLSDQKVFFYNDKISLQAQILYASKEDYSLVEKTDFADDQELQFEWTSLSNGKRKRRVGYLYWNILPLTWSGTVLINFTVSGYFRPKESRKAERDVNFNMCVLTVTVGPLVAVITGGIARFVFREVGMTLDASKSINPNALDRSSEMNFTFKCNWTEEAVCAPYSMKSKQFKPYVIKPNVLISRRVYTFTLTVELSDKRSLVDIGHNVLPGVASQVVVVGSIPENKTYLEEILIDCVYNCEPKTNIQDIVCLRIAGNWTRLVNFTFDWVYYEHENKESDKNEIPVNNIRQSDTPSFILILNENTLQIDKNYEFKATLIDSLQFAIFPIITTSLSMPKCNIKPERGYVGLTTFEVSCSSGKDSKILEYYDKNETDEPGFSGRMVTSQDPGNVEFLQITRGKLEIVSFNEVGMNISVVLTVGLSKGSLTSVNIHIQLANLVKYSAAQDIGETLQTASVLADLLIYLINSNDTYAVTVLENLIKFLSTISIKRYSHAKHGISTLHIALSAAHEFLSLDAAWYAARTLHTLIEAMAVRLKKGRNCTFNILYQIYSRILDCIYIIVKTQNNSTRGVQLQYTNPEFYTKVKEITKYVLKISFLLRSILSHRHLPAQKEKLIQARLGKISIWIKVDIPKELSKFTQQEHREIKFPVIIPNSLAEDVKRKEFYLGLQFIVFEHNPTWSQIPNTKNTIDASVCFKNSSGDACQFPSILENGLQVAFDTKDLTPSDEFTNITISKTGRNINLDLVDLTLPIYKVDPTPSAEVEVLFKLYSHGTELMVIANSDFRPNPLSPTAIKQKITKDNLVLPLVTDPSSKPKIYYMFIKLVGGVIDTVTVGIKVNSKTCLTWNNRWKTEDCRSIINQITSDFICECSKLSLIGGFLKDETLSSDKVAGFSLTVPPLDVGGDFNFKFDISISISLLFLLLLMIPLALLRRRRKEKKEKKRGGKKRGEGVYYGATKRLVNILPDNIPGDRFGYLVRVFTGARVGAGTDAAVGIRIIGSKHEGRSHILSSETHNVMGMMGEDWFLIFEPKSLGTITYVDLWHDNTGAHPAWFCDSLTIYDLQFKNCYVFIVDDWISLSSQRFPLVNIAPTPLSEIVSPSRVFLEYLMSGFLLSHIWVDVVARHPRDPVSTLDRLAIISCFIVVSMTFSLVVIKLTDINVDVGYFIFSPSWSTVKLGFYSCLVSGVVTCILMHMFRRIYTIIFYIEHRRNTDMNNVTPTRISVKVDYLTLPSVTTQSNERPYIHYGRRHYDKGQPKKPTFAEKVNLKLMPKPLVPVQLEGDEPNVKIQNKWLCRSWITFFVIFTICLFSSLFLFWFNPFITTQVLFTISGLAIFIHAVILLPIKIILVSAFLAVGCKRIIYKDVYTFDPKDGIQEELSGNLMYFAKLIFMRSLPKYQPLREVFLEEHRLNIHRSAMWHKIYELLVQIVFLIVISKLLETKIHYHNDVHLKTVIKAFKPECNATDIRDLQYRLEPDIFKYLWYNWKILSQGHELSFFRKDWLGGYNNRIIGKVRLRQFRVEPGHCKAWRNLTTDCSAPFTASTMDTNNYLPFWIKQNTSEKEEESPDQQYSDGWRFRWPNKDSNFLYTGTTGQKYPSGGYIWDLGASRDEMDAALDDLWEQGWVGHYTRAVLAHVKVYNVNTRTFSEVVLLAEQTIAGQFLPLTVVQSLVVDKGFYLWPLIFILFSFMLLVRTFILLHWVGIIGMFKNWRHLYEILMAVNAFAVSYYLLLHLVKPPQYVTDYLTHADELKFFDFYKMAHFAFTSKSLLYALYILIVIRFFSLWRFGKVLLRILFTIRRSLKCIIWLFSILILLQFILFRSFIFLLKTFIQMRFSSSMIYNLNHSSLGVTDSINGFKAFSFIVGSTNRFIMILFLLIFVQGHKAARYDLVTRWNVENFFTFVHEEVIAALKNPTMHKTSQKVVHTMAAKYGAKKRTISSQSQEEKKSVI